MSQHQGGSTLHYVTYRLSSIYNGSQPFVPPCYHAAPYVDAGLPIESLGGRQARSRPEETESSKRVRLMHLPAAFPKTCIKLRTRESGQR